MQKAKSKQRAMGRTQPQADRPPSDRARARQQPAKNPDSESPEGRGEKPNKPKRTA